jgi:Lrp/AsnC family transcriptional regulator for asnA, asnC and gidA
MNNNAWEKRKTVIYEATDDIDRRLIRLLQKDGRQNNRALARQVGTTGATVKAHLRKMIEREIMRVTVLVDPNRLRAPLGTIIGLDVTRKDIGRVIQQLSSNPAVLQGARTGGRFNVVAVAYFASTYELTEFAVNVLFNSDGIKSSELFIMLQVGRKGKEASPGLDDLDLELIKLLRKNGRDSTVSLGRKLELSPTTVQRRIRRLTREHFIRVTALVNASKVDWYWPAAVGLMVRRKSVTDVLSRLRQHPAVDFVTCTTGRFDIFASISAESEEKLFELVEVEISEWDGVMGCDLFVSQGTNFGPLWLD